MAVSTGHSHLQIITKGPLAEFDKLGGISIVKYFNFEKDCGLLELEQLTVFYRDVVSSYSKAIFFDIEVFKSTILNQPLWGNKFISVKKKGKTNVLLIRNWISSNIVFVKDLIFVNGVIDTSICDTVNNKRNICIEYASVKKALHPYADAIAYALSNVMLLEYEKKFMIKSSRSFYTQFICSKVDNAQVNAFLTNYCSDHNLTMECIFSRRVNLEREKKLQEFNFKVLHNILPCGTNLKKWRIVDCSSCDICHMEQTMLHLLYECKYVNHVWNHVSNVLGWNVESRNVIC